MVAVTLFHGKKTSLG